MDDNFWKHFLAGVVTLAIVTAEVCPYIHEKADLSHLSSHNHVAEQSVEFVGSTLTVAFTTTASTASLASGDYVV